MPPPSSSLEQSAWVKALSHSFCSLYPGLVFFNLTWLSRSSGAAQAQVPKALLPELVNIVLVRTLATVWEVHIESAQT